MTNQRRLFSHSHIVMSLVITLAAVSAAWAPVSSAGQTLTSTVTQGQSSELKEALALADFYYKNGDITDRAAVQYRKVRDKAPKSSEGATAQYYLGSYYHRKFYIQKEKKLKEDIGLLVEAQGQYDDYASKFAWSGPKPEWLTDAYFNLALISAQRGDSHQTEYYLGRMYGAAPSDQKVYVYQVVWSPNAKDVVDANVDSRSLAEYANSLVYLARQAQQKQAGQALPFNTFIERIRQWCVSQKTGQT